MRAYFRILSFGRPWYWMGIVAFLWLIVYTLFSAVSLVSAIPFLEILFSSSSILPPEQPLELLSSSSLKAHGYYYLSQQIQDFGRGRVLIYFCFSLLTFILIKNFARYMASYFMAPLEFHIIRKMRDYIFRHLTLLDLQFFSKNRKGDTINILTSDMQVIMESVISTVQGVVREPLTMLVFLITLLLISWQLTLFTLLVLPLTGLVINFVARPLKRQASQGQGMLSQLLAQLEEFITSIRIVKAFQKEAFEEERFRDMNRQYTDTQISIRRRTELASPLTEVISIAVVCLIIYYGGTMILGEESSLKASEFIGFIAIFSQFLAPIKTLSNIISKIQKGAASFERVEKLMAEQPQITDRPDEKGSASFEQTITFENIWFRYEEADVLKDISFSIPKGHTVALVGASGAGKSTLVDLIPRFYDPYRGSIRMDGSDLRDIPLKDLRSRIGIVAQEGILFHDTVLRNIAYGIENPDRQAVEEAARVANAHEFIMELPEQYDTVIGERGTLLSGGQRQRISIARAVLRNPSILILDEATSNLDTESERLVQDALDHLMKDRTSVVIAHRLSTILSADKILMIENGKITEQGTHEELLKMKGSYFKLFNLQFSSLN